MCKGLKDLEAECEERGRIEERVLLAKSLLEDGELSKEKISVLCKLSKGEIQDLCSQ